MTYINRVFNHSCESMPEIPDGSVHCVVTSPPYWGLRDYGVDGHIGAEATPSEYIERLVAVFSEVKRVLRDDGTAWVNLGDRHAPSPVPVDSSPFFANLKPKETMGLPAALAFALRNDGWYWRFDAIWHKTKVMPESVTDRPTRSHEYVLMLCKSPSYFYDAKAVAEPIQSGPSDQKKMLEKKQRIGGKTLEATDAAYKANKDTNIGNRRGVGGADGLRNRRSVWTIAPAPYSGAHFAAFPRELVRVCLLASCPPNGIVLDPFMGSGTTARVALEQGRQFVGYEINPEYCGLVQDRLGLFGEGVA